MFPPNPIFKCFSQKTRIGADSPDIFGFLISQIFQFCLFSSLSLCGFSSLCSSSVSALAAFDDCISHNASDQLYSTDCVIVTRDNVVDLIRIAVGVYDCNDRDVLLLCLCNSDALLAGVNDEQCTRQLLHILDTAQELLQLFNLQL